MFNAGDVNASSIVEIPFNTSAVAGESITMATNGTIAIYKDGSTTERSSLSGVTFTEDHDGDVGSQLIRIDLSDNTDPGFYSAGSIYKVKKKAAVIDGKTVNPWVGLFSIDKNSSVASLSAILADTNELQTDWVNGGRLDLLIDAILARMGTPSDLGGGATLAGNLSDIEAQTDDIGVAGLGLSAIPKTGFILAATGLDAITASDPGGVASTWPQMVVQVWRYLFKRKTKDSGAILTYGDDGTTVRTTQLYTSSGADDDVGAAT